MKLSLIALGPVAGPVIQAVSSSVAERLRMEVGAPRPWLLPWNAWDRARAQYDASQILRDLELYCPRDTARVLAITAADLFIPALTFVYGYARVLGSATVVSIRRLDPALCGGLPAPHVSTERACKETLHELGHSLGLKHCWRAPCVMNCSAGTAEIDLKPDDYCTDCRGPVESSLAALRSPARPAGRR